jgi:hypothetical protein
MKTIISGSRNLKDFDVVQLAIRSSGFTITEVVSGAADGVDTLGEQWADINGIPVKQFPADWKNIKAKGAVVKSNSYGKYNANAGHDRNKKMAEYAEACIAVMAEGDDTPGTSSMIKLAKDAGIEVYVHKQMRDDSSYEYIF